MLTRLIAIFSVLFLPTAFANSFDIRLADDSAQLSYMQRSDISIGSGGSDIAYSLFYNEANDIIVSGQILAAGNIQGTSRAFNLAIGAKAYAGKFDELPEDKLGAVGLGGKFSYVIPNSTPMAAYFEAYLAPSITSFGDIDGLFEWNIGFELEVAPSAKVYIGYREIEAELAISNIDYDLDDAVHVGINFTF